MEKDLKESVEQARGKCAAYSRKEEWQMKSIEVYVHIPFCAKKCNYCDFLSGPCSYDDQKQYIDALCKEIRSNGSCFQEYEVSSIFFGGGTPSLLSVELFERVIQSVKETAVIKADCEITIECNPKTVTREKLQGYKMLGVNRLSFGLQSANDEELKLLGRIHSYEDFVENYKLAREIGFTNINIDLMSALPYQTMDSYVTTLRKVLALCPEHISAYSLIIEEKTNFYERFSEGAKEESAMPSVELDRQMYEKTKELLSKYGYERYEISNYAKPGYECRHNIGYWKRVEYLGFGLGASSYYKGIRYHNEESLSEYLRCIYKYDEVKREKEILNRTKSMEEFMFLGLRMCEGVKSCDFMEQFHTSIENVYGKKLSTLLNEGVLTKTKHGYALTEYGIDVSNAVLAEFLLEE